MTRSLPDWLHPVVAGAATITAGDLTRFVPPDDPSVREGAVLMLFGDGARGPDLLVTERSREMRSHPGQISFPGGSLDPGDTGPQAAALREAQEEVGLDPAGVEVLAELPQLWLPPSNFAVTPVLAWWRDPSPVGVASPAEVASVHRVPIAELLDPAYRITVTHPSGYHSPGFLIGPEHDLILWGFTAGIITRVFDHVGWTRDWDRTATRDLPAYMLARDERRPTTSVRVPNTDFRDE